MANLKVAMNGRKRTELVQSTNERKKTRIKSAVLRSSPSIMVVSSQKMVSRMEEVTPTANSS